MIERVLLVAWKGSAATGWVETLKQGGYTVLLEDTTGERAWRTAKERGIDCVIIDGQKKPSHGRQTGHALRDTAKTRNIPIVWTNLDTEDSQAVASEVKPDVTLVAPTNAVEALAALESLQTKDHDHSAHAAAHTPPKPAPAAAPARIVEVVPAPAAPVVARPAPAPAPTEEPEAKKPAAKKAAAKKPAAKKPAAKKAEASKTRAKKPATAARRAQARR